MKNKHTRSTTVDCPKAGGTRLTISGANFGVSDASVRIGGLECTSVQHTPGKEHSQLTCNLPELTSSSKGFDMLVVVFQNQGQYSAEEQMGKISYFVCPKGTFSLGFDCPKCPAGTFSNAQVS
jgi:hypothetical protein